MKVKIKRGRFKGETFDVEGTIGEVMGTNDLPGLALFRGNWAAKNALEKDNYNIDDAPFFYGKIGGLGYILSEKEWKSAEKDKQEKGGRNGNKNNNRT